MEEPRGAREGVQGDKQTGSSKQEVGREQVLQVGEWILFQVGGKPLEGFKQGLKGCSVLRGAVQSEPCF